jgi:anti-anti-sigma regulatory factor
MEPGTLIDDRFRLEKVQPAGWRSDRWLAVDQSTGQPCEIELTRSSGKQSEEVRRLAEREVAIGDWLSEHDDILRALAWGTTEDGTTWIARQEMAGARPLPTKDGDMDERIWRVLSAAQLAASLVDRGVIHRNLGPYSILEAPDGSLRLSRLSLAKLDEVADPFPGPGGLPFASPRCTAPELFETPGATDARCDVFSLGVLMFHALSGRWPYPGPTMPQVLCQQQRVRYGHIDIPHVRERVPEVPAALDRLCADAMAMDLADRPASPGEFCARLEEWLAVGPAAQVQAQEDELPRTASQRIRLDVLDLETPPPVPEVPEEELVLDLGAGEPALPEAEPPSEPLAPTPALAAAPLPDLPAQPDVVGPSEGEEEEELEQLPPERFAEQGFGTRKNGAIVVTIVPKELEQTVGCLRQLCAVNYSHLLLDMTLVEHLMGKQLEHLTAILTQCERRSLISGMFGLRKEVRQLLHMMEMDLIVPRILDCQTESEAMEALDVGAHVTADLEGSDSDIAEIE